MFAIRCSASPSGRALVPATRVVGLHNGADGVITVTLHCYDGHVHTLRTGRAAARRVPVAA